MHSISSIVSSSLGERNVRSVTHILATTWSNPNATNVIVGHHIAMIFDEISREEIEMKTAKQTSQFAPIARRKI